MVLSEEVLIKSQDAKTSESTYLANACPSCDAFIGKFFIYDYLNNPEERYNLDL